MSTVWAMPLILAEAAGQTIGNGGSPVFSWALQFLVTLALELPMVLLAWRLLGCRDLLRPWLLACIIGNLMSHPAAVYLGTTLQVSAGGITGVATYMLIEAGSIMLEAWVFRLRATDSWSRAVMVALVVNAITALLGAQRLFGG